MGFGVALIGYAFLIFLGTGVDVLAAPLLAYGLFLASRLNKNFMWASISALFMLPRGIVNLLNTVNLVDLIAVPLLNVITLFLFLAAFMFTNYFWLVGVIQIAKDCSAAKLERQARNRLVLSVTAIILVATLSVARLAGLVSGFDLIFSISESLVMYLLIFTGALFMHTCFVLITSEKQYEKDKQQIAIERAKALEKRQKEKEEANRFGRKKK